MLRLQQLYRVTALLALITIFYNIAEGVIAIWFGAEDETITLFGFGLDSFVAGILLSTVPFLNTIGVFLLGSLAIWRAFAGTAE